MLGATSMATTRFPIARTPRPRVPAATATSSSRPPFLRASADVALDVLWPELELPYAVIPLDRRTSLTRLSRPLSSQDSGGVKGGAIVPSLRAIAGRRHYGLKSPQWPRSGATTSHPAHRHHVPITCARRATYPQARPSDTWVLLARRTCRGRLGAHVQYSASLTFFAHSSTGHRLSGLERPTSS